MIFFHEINNQNLRNVTLFRKNFKRRIFLDLYFITDGVLVQKLDRKITRD